MHLVFIYGPPAVGKTTIGREIARRTGYSFFFNHATVPAARAVFPHRHDPRYAEAYSDLLKALRYDGIKAAAETNTSIIFTLAYSGRVDDDFVTSIVDIVKRHGGTTDFIQLYAPDDTLYERVGRSDRALLEKVTDPEHLRELLRSRDLRARVPYDAVLHIDTTTISPATAAQKSINYFKLI